MQDQRIGAAGGFPPLANPGANPRIVNLVNQAYNRPILTPKRRKRTLNSGEVISENVTDENSTDANNSWSNVVNRNIGGQGAPTMNHDQTPKKHWRQKALLVNGTSNQSSDDKSFAADISLVAGGVSKNATVDKLTEYLKNKGLDIVQCELLTNANAIANVRSLSFKVTIKAEDLDKASDAAIWPYRVVVRKFVNFRRKEVDEFAPQQQQVPGVRRLGQGHAQAHVQAQPQYTPSAPVMNKFDVPGFREGVLH